MRSWASRRTSGRPRSPSPGAEPARPPPPWSDPRRRAWSCSRRCVPRRPRGPSARRSGRSSPARVDHPACGRLERHERRAHVQREQGVELIVRDIEQRLRRIRARADHQHVQPRKRRTPGGGCSSSGSRRGPPAGRCARARGPPRPHARARRASGSPSRRPRPPSPAHGRTRGRCRARPPSRARSGRRGRSSLDLEALEPHAGGERVPGERLGVARWRRRPAPPGACPRQSGAGRSPSSGTCPPRDRPCSGPRPRWAARGWCRQPCRHTRRWPRRRGTATRSCAGPPGRIELALLGVDLHVLVGIAIGCLDGLVAGPPPRRSRRARSMPGRPPRASASRAAGAPPCSPPRRQAPATWSRGPPARWGHAPPGRAGRRPPARRRRVRRPARGSPWDPPADRSRPCRRAGASPPPRRHCPRPRSCPRARSRPGRTPSRPAPARRRGTAIWSAPELAIA